VPTEGWACSPHLQPGWRTGRLITVWARRTWYVAPSGWLTTASGSPRSRTSTRLTSIHPTRGNYELPSDRARARAGVASARPAEQLGRSAHDLVMRYVLQMLGQTPPVSEGIDDLSVAFAPKTVLQR